ncbi:unnamed protein product [Sphagnum balticum]
MLAPVNGLSTTNLGKNNNVKHLSTVLALVLALSFFLEAPSAEARRRKKFKGVIIVNQILKLKGTIKRNGLDVPEYSGVKQGDLLETAEKSEAVIRIPGLGIFRMGPSTEFKLTQFNDRNESRLTLVSGSLLALYRRQGNHELTLNHSQIKIHGTTFLALSPRDGKLDQICLCDGKITVSVYEPKQRKPKGVATPAGVPAASPVASIAPSASPAVNVTPTLVMASATPTAAPSPPAQTAMSKELVVASKDEHKMCEVSAEGVELQTVNKLLDLHTTAEIKELESLYNLP